MGDTTDGSSAAHGAQEETGTEPRGLFSRLFDAFSPDEVEGQSERLGRTLPGLANLQRLRVEDVAVPKAEIVALSVDTDLKDIVQEFRNSGYSRIPVYEDTLDKPLGLLLLKDLALHYGFNGHHDLDLAPLLRPILYVPPSMTLSVLLRKMQADRTHMALVIDEYGGVDGLVTIEDLLEQVVGEIEDEHDTEEEVTIQRVDEATYMADARTPLEELEEVLGMTLAYEDMDEEVDTLGGLVFVLSGHVPVRGEMVEHPSGLEFEVIEADPRRIRRLRVHLPEGLQSAPQ
ncbi:MULTISPECIES: transporter associated domain-containing protein [Roseinatronobacter]|uniref:Hemolysin family protein n=1 Tax=Roseinatronobacter domitianus TaxID=2940293 RepID=A0ABT0LZD8_9RHOB|nr:MULTISPECIES: hemolysin family protein [Roseibaca]MCL1627982.1 hemolysin family protein [Roseibaca domitiana]